MGVWSVLVSMGVWSVLVSMAVWSVFESLAVWSVFVSLAVWSILVLVGESLVLDSLDHWQYILQLFNDVVETFSLGVQVSVVQVLVSLLELFFGVLSHWLSHVALLPELVSGLEVSVGEVQLLGNVVVVGLRMGLNVLLDIFDVFDDLFVVLLLAGSIVLELVASQILVLVSLLEAHVSVLQLLNKILGKGLLMSNELVNSLEVLVSLFHLHYIVLSYVVRNLVLFNIFEGPVDYHSFFDVSQHLLQLFVNLGFKAHVFLFVVLQSTLDVLLSFQQLLVDESSLNIAEVHFALFQEVLVERLRHTRFNLLQNVLFDFLRHVG
ncbi:unnamed protein product [Ceutorhynchus assimilis]|uniref:Uncharacterized protein n=1 Tax=Ceutorhynchus assimilis TaxID=467358 RepID=A0A9P0GPH7_9CUCU|nr:unnamed protein product [Ceutorhynchus assimilis]